MTSLPAGCGLDQPFELLSDVAPSQGKSLPAAAQAAYGGDWALPTIPNRPYVYSNFVVPRDGRVSYNIPGQMGGGDVSGGNLHDRWLMGLLRARADIVFMGDNTLRLEPEHLWTASYIFPEAAAFFANLRTEENRTTDPIQCFVSLSGNFDPRAAIFNTDLDVIIATTRAGARRAAQCGLPKHVKIIALGEDGVNIKELMGVFAAQYGVKTALCEGGPGLYGSCLKDGAIDDEFLCLAPFHLGQDRAQPRPGLIEGVSFIPGEQPVSKLQSVRKVGDFLYIQSNITYQS